MMNNTIAPFKQFNNPVQNITTKSNISITSTDRESFDNISVNSDKNVFLKEYLEKLIQKNGVELTEEFIISVGSPDKLSKADKKLLRDVRVDIYKARVDDLFKLLEQPEEYVNKRISEMKISDKDKKNLKLLKEKYDNYYTITLKYGDKTYNIMNLSESEKEELKSKNPKLAEVLDNEKDNLDKITKQFASSEIKKEVLAESGRSSRYGAYALVPVLAVLMAQAVFEQRAVAKAIKTDKAKYLQDQIEIFNQGNPLKKYFSKGGFKEYVNSIKEGNNNWWRVLAIAFAGSWDDDLGAVKDFFQDNDNFGVKRASLIAIPSMIMTVVLLYIHTVMDFDFDINEGKKTVANSFDSQLESLILLKIFLIISYLSLILLCIFDILDWQVMLVLLTVPLAIDLYNSMLDYSTNKDSIPQRKWYYYPMENMKSIKRNNAESFMIRMYQSRNLMMYFSILLVIAEFLGIS